MVIDRGRTVAQGRISDITRLSRITVSVVGEVSDAALRSVSEMEDVLEVSKVEGGLTLRLDGGEDRQADLVRDLVSMGLRVYAVRKEDPLEEAFMHITGGDGE